MFRHAFGWFCLALVVVLYLVNLAVYSGFGIEDTFALRVEHGRFTVRIGEQAHRRSFYVAINSEPLRFGLDGRWYGPRNWWVAIPFWLPFSIVLGVIALWPGRRERIATEES